MSYPLEIYFGLPGSGKTTIANSIVQWCYKHKITVYSNVPLSGALKLSCSLLGKIDYSECYMIIDEAGIEFNNRNFKSFNSDQLLFFKLHRHYRVRIAVFSQTYNDMDLKIRSLADRLYLVRKSLIPYHISITTIRKRIMVDNDTHDIVDGYFIDTFLMQIFTSKRIFSPLHWKGFDSFDAPALPKAEPKVW